MAEVEWRWIDENGRAMTKWKTGNPPAITEVRDSKGTMRVETRNADETPQLNKETP